MGSAEGPRKKEGVILMGTIWKDEAGMRWGNCRQRDWVYWCHVWGGKPGSLISESSYFELIPRLSEDVLLIAFK